MDYSKFPQLLEKSLIEWRIRQTRKRQPTSLNAFAIYLEFSRPIVSQWLNGDRRPTHENSERLIPKMIELIGDEAYDAFGLPRPNPDLQALMADWDYIPSEKQHALREQGKQYKIQNQNDENPLGQ